MAHPILAKFTLSVCDGTRRRILVAEFHCLCRVGEDVYAFGREGESALGAIFGYAIQLV